MVSLPRSPKLAGSWRLALDPRGRLGSWLEGKTIAVSNALGATVCTIRFGVEVESGGVLSLPDGSEAAVMSAA